MQYQWVWKKAGSTIPVSHHTSLKVEVAPEDSQSPTLRTSDVSIESSCIYTAWCDIACFSLTLVFFVLLLGAKFAFYLQLLPLFWVIHVCHLLARRPSTSFFIFFFPSLPYNVPSKILKLRLPGPEAISIFILISLLPAQMSPLVCLKSSISPFRKQLYFKHIALTFPEY